MRERVTFLYPKNTEEEAGELDIRESGLLGPQALLASQVRLTIGLDELSKELREVLLDYAKVDIKWGTSLTYDTIDPFTSRISPGVHADASWSGHGSSAFQPEKLCMLLQSFGEFPCMLPENWIMTKGNTSVSVYQPIKDLHGFIKEAMKYCPEVDSNCIARIGGLQNAASIDLTYDRSSQTLRIATFWPLSEQKVAVPASEFRRTEVGILSETSTPNMDLHHIGLGGRLVILGLDKKDPEPTLFSFPSRHRPDSSHFSVMLLQPAGLHPTLQMKFESSKPPSADDDCKPYAYLTLPKTIFADRYQLDDKLFMTSKNLSKLIYSSSPADLEAPAYTMSTWGSNLLVELAQPPSDIGQRWTAEIPLHLRYLEPSASGERQIDVPYPAVFWACEATDLSGQTNPFDRTRLGYDDHFSSDTIFWHVKPKPEAGNSTWIPVTIPVLKDEASPYVAAGTTAVIVAGFGWLLWKLIGAYRATGYDASPAKVEDVKLKKNN